MATSSIYQSPWATSKHTLPVLFIHKIMYKTIQIDTESLSKYLFYFMNSPTGQTRRRIFTLDGSNDVDSRKDVPFGGFVDIALHFGGEIPQKLQFWGRE